MQWPSMVGRSSLTRRLLPLWILTYWSRIHQLRPRASARHRECEHSLECLDMVPWKGEVAINADREDNVELAIFFSQGWLKDIHLNQMLSVLERELTSHNPGRGVKIVNTYFTAKLCAMYESSADKSYADWKAAEFLRLGEGLGDGSCAAFGGIFLVNSNHWIAVVVDVQKAQILYGDSLAPAEAPSDAVIAPLKWWLLEHFSCGLLSYNAISHYFMPTEYPILGPSRIDCDLGRLYMVRKIVELMGRLCLTLTKSENLALEAFRPGNSSGSSAAPTSGCSAEQSPISVHPIFKPSDAPSNKRKHNDPSSSTLIPSNKRPKKNTEPKKDKNNHAVDIGIASTSKAKLDDSKLEYHRKDDTDCAPAIVHDAHTTGKVASRGLVKTNGAGRPRMDILDKFAEVFYTEDDPQKPKYRCLGHSKGCTRNWTNRNSARIITHASECGFLSRTVRDEAVKKGSQESLGAQVAAMSDKQRGPLLQNISSTGKLLLESVDKAGAEKAIPDRFEKFSMAGRKELNTKLNFAIMQFICVSGVPPSVIDLQEWKNIFAIANSSYKCVSRTTMVDFHIAKEQLNVERLQFAYLRTQINLTVTYDGGSNRAHAAYYTVHVSNPERRRFLARTFDATLVVHTGEWIKDIVLEVMTEIGRARFAGVSSDNTGNTRVGRREICAAVKTLINIPDPIHHISNMIKDLVKLPFFKPVVKELRGILTFFHKSPASLGFLKNERVKMDIGRGLEAIGKTRFGTVILSAISLRRCLAPIRQLVSRKDIQINKYNHLFIGSASTAFEMRLNQLIDVGLAPVKAIRCLEAGQTNAADVYLFWLAIVAALKRVLDDESNLLPDEVRREVRGVVNKRWRQYFDDGPSQVHLTAFYLNPNYVQSSIFNKPNPLKLTFTLSGTNPAPKPDGIRSPKTFKKVGDYLFSLAVDEMKEGVNPVFTKYRGQGTKAMGKVFKDQFTAYSLRHFPFGTPLATDQGQTVMNWWEILKSAPMADLLAHLAIKIYSIVPYSIEDERTQSTFTWTNSYLRSRQTIKTVSGMTQIRQFYRSDPKTRPTAVPIPTVKFYDIQKDIAAAVDKTGADEGEGKHEDHEDEEEEEVRVADNDEPIDETGGWLDEPPSDEDDKGSALAEPSSTFGLEDEDDAHELDLEGPFIADVLSDDPPSQPEPVVVQEDIECPILEDGEGEDGNWYTN